MGEKVNSNRELLFDIGDVAHVRNFAYRKGDFWTLRLDTEVVRCKR
jgi:hypothetical protein